MADLAKEANVSVGAIYRSYASKADIILAIILADSARLLGELQDDVEHVRRGEIGIEAAIEQIVLRRLSDKDEALTHEMLAEAHRNHRVASSISDFCVAYKETFADLAKLAHPALSGDELQGVAELLLACMFGLGHRELTRPQLDEATTAKVTAQLTLRLLRKCG